jgi:hypothetical protein
MASLRLGSASNPFFTGESNNDLLLTCADSNRRIFIGTSVGEYAPLTVASNVVTVGGELSSATVSANIVQATGINLSVYDPRGANMLEVITPMFVPTVAGGATGGVDVATSNQAFRIATLSRHPDASSNITNISFFTAPAIGSNPVERMRITSNGFVGIGTSNPEYTLHVEGDLYCSGDITGLSDCNLKRDIRPIGDALGKLSQVSGYTFSMLGDASGRRHAGVLAQEVAPVLPEVVSQNGQGMLSVAYGNMSALLINAIKELRSNVNDLKARI